MSVLSSRRFPNCRRMVFRFVPRLETDRKETFGFLTIFRKLSGFPPVAETFPDRIHTYPAGSVFCLSEVGRNIVKRPVRSGFRPAYPLPAKNFGDASADELFAGCGGRPLSLGEQGLGRQHIDRRRDLDVFVRALA